MEDYICRDDFCHLHLSILTNGVFPRRNLLSSNQKMGEWSPMLTNIFKAYKRVQSCLHSEIYRTCENKQNIICKLSVCRLPISFVQATWSFIEATSFVKQLYHCHGLSPFCESSTCMLIKNNLVTFCWKRVVISTTSTWSHACLWRFVDSKRALNPAVLTAACDYAPPPPPLLNVSIYLFDCGLWWLHTLVLSFHLLSSWLSTFVLLSSSLLCLRHITRKLVFGVFDR